jgi:hypothetical protein
MHYFQHPQYLGMATHATTLSERFRDQGLTYFETKVQVPQNIPEP